jgi:hypothetical protein
MQCFDKNSAGRKLREDLTPEEKEKAARIGSIEFKSNRYRKTSHYLHVHKFLPSREQH